MATLHASLAACALAVSATIGIGDAAYTIAPETLALEYRKGDRVLVLSEPSATPFSISAFAADAATARWTAPERGLSFVCTATADGAFEMAVEGAPDSSIEWPHRAFASGEELILARDSGILVSPADPFWRAALVESEWDTLERMSMPVWGILDGGACASWMVSTPFRNRIAFRDDAASGGLSLAFSHDFSALSPERRIVVRVVVDENASPIAPGLRYREWLDATVGVTTLREKAKAIPQVDRLLGAPHVYLWGDAPISWLDISAPKWKPFCARLVAEATTEGSAAARLKAAFADEQWASVVACTRSEWPDRYMKRQIADGLAAVLRSETFESGAASEPERIRANAQTLAAAFPDTFGPPDEWGDGVSLKMMRRLADLGFDRLRLCVPDWQGIQARPHVAADAAERGWLVGTYDSYHSVHDPATAGSDSTWTTAQMTVDLWRDGGIMRENGAYLTGFKGVGRKLNPLAARPFFEERTSAVLASVPFNYYFVDCDAYGEVYDDFNPLHRNPLEADAAERTRRLGWLASEKRVVVGAEGGNVYAIEGVHVLEGIVGPYFGWDDADMRDPKSPYFRGKYYPPDEPAIQFKPVPVKEEFRRLHYDPAVRIPLFQAAFHDAVVTTHHWSNDRFKYPDVATDLDLVEMLWMCPPMANLNLSSLDERGPALREHFAAWSPLHRRLGFARMTGFRYLSADRLVQETAWEDGTRVVANFGEKPFADGSLAVEARTSATIAPEID